MVGVAVAQHDRLDVAEIGAERIEVVEDTAPRDAGVEQKPLAAIAVGDLDQRCEPVLRDRKLAPEDVRRERPPLDGALAGHEHVERVVDENRDRDLSDLARRDALRHL